MRRRRHTKDRKVRGRLQRALLARNPSSATVSDEAGAGDSGSDGGSCGAIGELERAGELVDHAMLQNRQWRPVDPSNGSASKYAGGSLCTSDVVALETGAAKKAEAAAIARQECIEGEREADAYPTSTSVSSMPPKCVVAMGPEIPLPDDLSLVSHVHIKRVRQLGRGGFGTVWLVHVKGTERAMKIIHGHREERGLKMEAIALAQVYHEHVVRIMGFCTDPGHCGLLMEVAEMGSLRDVLKDHPDLPLWRRFELLCGAERAMWHVHTFREGKPLLHGDLKPENLLVCKGWVCKVADFGLARGVTSEHGTVQKGLTARYAPPEVLDNHQPTTASDVFSYGMTAWEVITGESLWQGMQSKKSIIDAIIAGTRPLIPAECDEHFTALLPQCWAREPAERISFASICKLSEAAAERIKGRRGE
jgi:hypothetical protein